MMQEFNPGRGEASLGNWIFMIKVSGCFTLTADQESRDRIPLNGDKPDKIAKTQNQSSLSHLCVFTDRVFKIQLLKLQSYDDG
jgi:hypothetical protein